MNCTMKGLFLALVLALLSSIADGFVHTGRPAIQHQRHASFGRCLAMSQAGGRTFEKSNNRKSFALRMSEKSSVGK